MLGLEQLGRAELPAWVRLLHGCLRGVDLLQHGGARRLVGRRGTPNHMVGWSEERGAERAHLEAGSLLECA